MEAIKLAESIGLDLVEISPSANPPVCKVVDYSKFLYLEEQKAKQRSKAKKIELKEIKLRPNIDTHDLNTKIKHIEKFLAEGDKIKISVNFKGREATHPEVGKRIILTLIAHFSEMAEVSQPNSKDPKNLILLLAPKK